MALIEVYLERDDDRTHVLHVAKSHEAKIVNETFDSIIFEVECPRDFKEELKNIDISSEIL